MPPAPVSAVTANRREAKQRLLALARQQGGVVRWDQAQDLGLTRGQLRSATERGDWQQHRSGLIVPSPEPLEGRGRVWAAHLLTGGRGAIAGPAAEWLVGLRAASPAQIRVDIPADQRAPVGPEWISIRRRRGLADLVDPAATPARLRIEVLVLDAITPTTSLNDVAGLLTRACQQGLTTPARLLATLERRRYQPQRQLLRQLLEDVADGVRSSLEWRYYRDVERAHGLPRSERNVRELTRDGVRYRDAKYRQFRLAVELDGRLYHPESRRHLDQWRDNELSIDGFRTLRYRWMHLDDPCAVAMQVARALQVGGWTGSPRACAAACRILSAA
ncbi:MAG: hypothetical protein ACTHK1_02870 [Actinomycetales bacterium]